MAHWLNKYIIEQREQRRALGRNAASLQERAEREDWDKPKRKGGQHMKSPRHPKGNYLKSVDNSPQVRRLAKFTNAKISPKRAERRL